MSEQISCSSCGAQISKEATVCPICGQPSPSLPKGSTSPKSRLTALILCFFLGAFGIHRFYVGKPLTGVLQIFTLGGIGIWAFIDLIIIATGSFKDKQGRKLLNW